MNKEKFYMLRARDFLFEEYLDTLDMKESWRIKSRDAEKTLKERRYSADVVNILSEHLKLLSDKLVELDTEITKRYCSFDLYTQIKEIN